MWHTTTHALLRHAGIATLLVGDPYMIYQYSWYMTQTIAPNPDPGWNPMKPYSPPTEHWTVPWTSSFGVTTVLVVSASWVGVTHRIKDTHAGYKACVHAIMLASHVIYWSVYLHAKKVQVACLLCWALLWVVMVSHECVSLCGANGFTEMNISNLRYGSLRKRIHPVNA